MDNFKAMEKVLEEMGVSRTITESISFKRITVIDSGGSEATFYFDKSGKWVKDVPIKWVTGEQY
ncbi:hypothetical protein ACIQ1D_19650 [Lysinibacillus xylanilyticus]|uniref:hypothetical protein n=1 Tax=Lysinibacillus xylanilyticus TaxID=582475 RepID=UPI0037F2A926